jgi:aquaporin Z
VLAGDKIGFLGISFAFGLSLLAMAYAIGPISGCHINPAVTFGLWLCRKIETRHVPGYVAAQILGAVVGAGVILVMANGAIGGYDAAAKGLAANGYGVHSPELYGLGAAFVAEFVLTFFLLFTVLGATDIESPAGFAGIPIGLVLVLIHLVGIPITNTSVNPARSIGPAVFVGGWAIEQLWLFILAPLAGAGIAALTYRAVRTPAPLITARTAEQALPTERVERAI